MSKLDFSFNFGNEPNFVYYHWLMATQEENVHALVEEAFRQVEGDAEVQMGVDVSTVARDMLAELLQERFFEGFPDNLYDESLPNLFGNYGGSYHDLATALSVWAVNHIAFDVVAQAVLMSLGKWNPDTTVPEIV